jgi:hypothetical protein
MKKEGEKRRKEEGREECRKKKWRERGNWSRVGDRKGS